MKQDKELEDVLETIIDRKVGKGVLNLYKREIRQQAKAELFSDREIKLLLGIIDPVEYDNYADLLIDAEEDIENLKNKIKELKKLKNQKDFSKRKSKRFSTKHNLEEE